MERCSDMDVRERFLRSLGERGMLGEGGLTRYGQPAWRDILPGHEPQSLDDATAAQCNIVVRAHAVPALAGERCAAWVESVFSAYGLALDRRDARELYVRYCNLEDTAELRVGMIVAVPRAPYTDAAARYGHIGLYIGDGQIMDCAEGKVRKLPLELWLSNYGVQTQPRWGWLGGLELG